MSDIEPIPADHPHLANDPLYQAMSPKEKLEHRRMLAIRWRMEREHAEYRAAHPPEPTFEERVLAVLERIDQKLDRILELSRAELLRLVDERMGKVLEQIHQQVTQERR